MPEDWGKTSSDNRSEDQLTIYIIFCEDENDEPYYFRSFEIKGKVKINCIPNQKKARLNLENTLKHCYNNGLIECTDHNFKLKEGITENIWCVYDRDLELTDLSAIKQEDDIKFTTAIQTAEKAGLKVAWSNDAFELWILLHFEEVSPEKKIHRELIYSKLTDIFKELLKESDDFKKNIQSGMFNYKAHLKKRFHFLKYVLPIIKDKLGEALKNAKILESRFDKNVPYHDCNPCTRVHHLINSILSQ